MAQGSKVVASAQRQRKSGGVCGGGAAGKLGLGVADHVEIALAHEDVVVRADEDRAEGVVPVFGGLRAPLVGGAEMGDHLVAGHGGLVCCLGFAPV